MLRSSAALLLCSFAAALFAALNAASAASLDSAMRYAQVTGRPLMVLVTSESCGPCRALKQRLSTDASLQSLLAAYVIVELEHGSADFHRWAAKYPPPQQIVPMIFVVGPGGQLLHSVAGVPAGGGLAQLLADGAAHAQAERLARATTPSSAPPPDPKPAPQETLESRSAGGDSAAAEPLLQEPPNEGMQSFAAADLLTAQQQMLTAFRAEGEAELARIREKLAVEDKDFYALMGLLKVRRIYGQLPGLGEQVQREIERFREDPQRAAMLLPAELVDLGRRREAEGRWDEAAEVYRIVLAQYPTTLAARVCQLRIEQIGEGRVAVRSP